MLLSAGPCGSGSWIGCQHDVSAAVAVPSPCRAGLAHFSTTLTNPQCHGPARPRKSSLLDLWHPILRTSGKPDVRCHPRPDCGTKNVHAGNKSGHDGTGFGSTILRNALAIVLASFLSTVLLAVVAQGSAGAAEDRFQQAINYVFSGKVDPANGPEIVDRQSCVVLVPEPKFNRYARYYLNRFKMERARISKKYAGSQTLYELEVEGDDVVLEYLKADRTTADYGFRSAHISLPGDPDQTDKALALIFSQFCKAEKPRSPF
jgi:hypothetical protein